MYESEIGSLLNAAKFHPNQKERCLKRQHRREWHRRSDFAPLKPSLSISSAARTRHKITRSFWSELVSICLHPLSLAGPQRRKPLRFGAEKRGHAG